MIVREISADDAAQIASRQESHFFDFKAREVAPRKVEVVAVAFANADGGEIVVGVDDPSTGRSPFDRWRGFSSIEDMNALLQSLFGLSPPLDLRYEILKCEGPPSYVLNIRVEKGASVHKTADSIVYQRQGAQSLPLKDPARIAELGFAKGASSYEDTVVQDFPAEIIVDSAELKELLAGSSPSVDALDFVINQNLLDPKSWSPRVAAALLFAPVPSAVIPKKCAIKVTRYETAEDDPERDHLAAQYTIEAPAYQAISQTIEIVRT